MFSKLTKSLNYRKSNSIFSIDFTPSQKTLNLAVELLKAENSRQEMASKFLDSLSFDAKILPPKLKISQTKQWNKRKNGLIFKLYGYYRPKSKYIYIQNLTGVLGKPVAAKTFLNTLLHEWLHHYDTEKLKLYSIHTKGFYLRLTSLKNSLGL